MSVSLIVTGPGRSGTSAIARILHESGFSMGEALAPASEWNSAGFYEETPVVEINEQIVNDLGMEGMRNWPSRRDVLNASASYAGAMRHVVAASTARGWKDPRFSITLEAWLPYLSAPPKVVVCLRSPEAFINSTISIFGLSPRDVLESWWSNHLRRILDVIREYRLSATSVVFDDLVCNPAETVEALSRFVALPLDAACVRPELRHHADGVLPHLRSLYDEVRALSWRRSSADDPG